MRGLRCREVRRQLEKFDILRDMAERTGGDVYIGVVGPVRTGKSTLIRRFMELMVLPHMEDPNERERARDELPQAGTGRTIMTTEPKFIPADGAMITVRDQIQMRVRLVDCVGYQVEGALGYDEAETPRLVRTPWFEEAVPFETAAEVGTRKVIAEHSTLGFVVTTDGTVTDLPRERYEPAEERVIAELKELGKPFVVILNTARPYAEATQSLAQEIASRHDVGVMALNVAELTAEDVDRIFQEALMEFPVSQVTIALPDWVAELDDGHWLKSQFQQAVASATAHVRRLRDLDAAIAELRELPSAESVTLAAMELGTGTARVETEARSPLFYQVLSEIGAAPVEDRGGLMRQWRLMAHAKREYDKVEDALRDVRQDGYGLVAPSLDEMNFEEPELVRQGNRFGVRLRAGAPSIHMIRADVQTEVTPLMGTEKQCEELMHYLLDRFEDNPALLWESDIFGKSLSDLVREGIQNKLFRMPENAQVKLQETLQRIVNEGSGGLICIII